ncbi:MAG: glutamine amidotransferase [Anaerolineaceae bacterium]|nr:glutamine amidotransferase [Anaerolineaceae bacterium]
MMHLSRQALVLNHVAFEDLGSLQPELYDRGFTIETIDVSTACFPLAEAQSCDLLVVLGGPIGVYDTCDYPFLKDEITCIRQRLSAKRPILGICLGAQLMAAALGARVYPGGKGPEIGWFLIQASDGERPPDWFAPLLAPGLSVFHWHGDTFDLPVGAQHLAKSQLFLNQAFTIDSYALGLQFHPEVTADGLERWYVGHACELRAVGIQVEKLREASRKNSPALENAARIFWKLWLDYIL